MEDKKQDQQHTGNNSNTNDQKQNSNYNNPEQQKIDPGQNRSAISDRSGAGQQQNASGSPIKN